MLTYLLRCKTVPLLYVFQLQVTTTGTMKSICLLILTQPNLSDSSDVNVYCPDSSIVCFHMLINFGFRQHGNFCHWSIQVTLTNDNLVCFCVHRYGPDPSPGSADMKFTILTGQPYPFKREPVHSSLGIYEKERVYFTQPITSCGRPIDWVIGRMHCVQIPTSGVFFPSGNLSHPILLTSCCYWPKFTHWIHPHHCKRPIDRSLLLNHPTLLSITPFELFGIHTALYRWCWPAVLNCS